MLGDNGLHALFDFGELRFIAIREHGRGDELAHHVEVFGIEAARGSSRRAHANAARHKRAAGLVGNGVSQQGMERVRAHSVRHLRPLAGDGTEV